MTLEIGELALVIHGKIRRNIGKVVRVTDVQDFDDRYCIEAAPVVGLLDYAEFECIYSTDEPVWFRPCDLMPIEGDRLEGLDREIADWQESYGVCDDE